MKQLMTIALLLVLSFNIHTQNTPSVKGNQQIAEPQKRIKIPSRMPITLRLAEKLDATKIMSLQVGQIIKMKVAVSVFHEGEMVAQEGALAEAVVVDIKQPKGNGKEGILVLRPSNFVSYDNSRVRLYPQPIIISGESRREFAKTFLFIPGFNFLGLTVKGRLPVIDESYQFAAEVENDVFVNSNPSASLSEVLN